MILFCDGMPRSASTWAFNVGRQLLHSQDNMQPLFSSYSEDHHQLLSSLDPTWSHIIIKTHSLDRLSEVLCQAGAARAIYTWRHPYDAIASTMRMFNQPFEIALESIRRSIEVWQFHKSTGSGIVVSYTEIVDNAAGTIERLADYLELDLAHEHIDQIALQTSFERFKHLSQNIEKLGADRLAVGVHSIYDRETQLHHHHIQDGSSGYGERLFSPAQLRAIDDMLNTTEFALLSA